MPHPLSHKYPIPISQLCLVNTDVPAGVGAPPVDTTTVIKILTHCSSLLHSAIVLLLVVYYFFAIIGMEAFSTVVRSNCW